MKPKMHNYEYKIAPPKLLLFSTTPMNKLVNIELEMKICYFTQITYFLVIKHAKLYFNVNNFLYIHRIDFPKDIKVINVIRFLNGAN